jgi:hypothetical protein
MNGHRPMHGLFVCALLVCAACSRPQPAREAAAPAAEPAALNACALVTKADVAAAAGLAAKEVKQGISTAMTTQCTFVAEDGTTLDVLIKRSPVKYDVEEQVAGMKKAMPGLPMRDAPGIGDRAFYMGGQLSVFRGDLYVLVSMLGFPPGPRTDAAAARLARKVLSQV